MATNLVNQLNLYQSNINSKLQFFSLFLDSKLTTN